MRWSRVQLSRSFRKIASWFWISSFWSLWITPCRAVCAPPPKADGPLSYARSFQPSMFLGPYSVKSRQGAARRRASFSSPRIPYPATARLRSPACSPEVTAARKRFPVSAPSASPKPVLRRRKDRSPNYAFSLQYGYDRAARPKAGLPDPRERSVRPAHIDTVRPIYKGVKWLDRIISTHATP